MSHFYGSILGQAKTEATRRGSKASGLTAHIRTWTEGVKLHAYVDTIDGEELDVVHVYSTSGSNGGESDTFLGQIVRGRFIAARGEQ